MSSTKPPAGNDRTIVGEICFPSWAPQAAQRRIRELCATPLGSEIIGRDFLKRLATYEAMKTEVWAKLPPEPKDCEANIVEWSFVAFTIFPRLGRPVPKTKAKWREWVEHRKKYPLCTIPKR